MGFFTLITTILSIMKTLAQTVDPAEIEKIVHAIEMVLDAFKKHQPAPGMETLIPGTEHLTNA